MSDVDRPQLWVFAGPNGAGKSTLVRRHVAGRLPIVNPDDIAREIEPGHQGDAGTMLWAGRLAIQRRQAQLKAGGSFGLETTLTGRGELAFMQQASAAGYKVTLVFIGLRDVVQSRSRVAERVRRGGHPVPIADIERRFDRSLAHLALAMKVADRVLVLDNSDRRTRLLLSTENGRTKHITRRLPTWAKKAIPAALRRDRSY